MSGSVNGMLKRPPLPAGKDRHHVVVLEGTHVAMPTFDFPHTLDTYPRTPSERVLERIKDASIVITCVEPITPEHLDVAKDVRCLAIMAVGISWVNTADFARRGLTVTNCAGGNVEAVCEHFLALYFGLRKKVVEIDHAVKNTNEWAESGTMITHWPNKKPPPGCKQETLGIIGYGTIGKRLEMLAKALGFGKVLLADRKGAKNEQLRKGRTAFEEVVANSSTIVVCVPKADDTINLIDEAELTTMRPDALVINIARGGIVNETALAKALKDGRIAGAAADVIENEPRAPGTSPLLPDLAKGEASIPNLIICKCTTHRKVKTLTSIAPHIAWFTQSTIVNYQQMLKDGVEKWVDGTLEEGGTINPIVRVHEGKVYV
jgi:phosphoglycerate dehydrogenase-like enzyme